MKSKFTISESEKNRIRGLHTNFKNMLTEDSGHEEAMHYGSDEGHDDKELYDLERHVGDLEDDMHYDHIHDDYDMEEAYVGGYGHQTDYCCDSMRPCCTDKDHPHYDTIHPAGHEVYGKVDHSDRDEFDGRKSRVVGVDSDIKKQRELKETVLPKGWKMKTITEIEEERSMDELYEIWSGKEDRDFLLKEMNEPKEKVYELPARFGHKRLTESQLVNMIKTITK
tara:strand:+ start:1106 stop:1777 length:672 start_codon:yes stop_codon:yes gene_type:complete